MLVEIGPHHPAISIFKATMRAADVEQRYPTLAKVVRHSWQLVGDILYPLLFERWRAASFISPVASFLHGDFALLIGIRASTVTAHGRDCYTHPASSERGPVLSHEPPFSTFTTIAPRQEKKKGKSVRLFQMEEVEIYHVER